MAESNESAHINWVINNPGQDSFLFQSIAKLADYQKRLCTACDKLFATPKNKEKHFAKFHCRTPENVANESVNENDQNHEPNLENQRPAPMNGFREMMNQTNERNEDNSTIDAEQNKQNPRSGRISLRDLDASSGSNWVLGTAQQKIDPLKIRLKRVSPSQSRKVQIKPRNKDRICPICDKLFVSSRNRDKHMANCHKQNQNVDNDANVSMSTGESEQNHELISDNHHSMDEIRGTMNEKENDADLEWVPDCRSKNTSGIATSGSNLTSKRMVSNGTRKALVPMPMLLDMEIKTETNE